MSNTAKSENQSAKSFKFLKEMDLKGKKVLVRLDLNVPLDKKGNITDDTRIKAALPTIQQLIDNDCKIVIISHMGRPKGKVVEELRLAPVAAALKKMFGRIVYIDHIRGDDVKDAIDKLHSGEIILLENIQFDPGEVANDPQLGKVLASYADVFVMDAFGQAHREYASICQVPLFLQSCAGMIIEKEIEMLSKAQDVTPYRKPFVAIIGGAKKDKIQAIENLLPKLDRLIVGGMLANTFLAAAGKNIGKSMFDQDSIDSAKKLLKNRKEKILLPVDGAIANGFKDLPRKEVLIDQVPDEAMILDIGEKTIKLYKNALSKAKTIVWCGPIGVFEFANFRKGTEAIAKYMTKLQAMTIIGGGDSAAAVRMVGVADKMTHVSTGGGASLTFLQGKKLPAVKALEESAKKFK